jgi:hypothetical protein
MTAVCVNKQIDLDSLFEGEWMILFESLEDSDANHHYLDAMCNQLSILYPEGLRRCIQTYCMRRSVTYWVLETSPIPGWR